MNENSSQSENFEQQPIPSAEKLANKTSADVKDIDEVSKITQNQQNQRNENAKITPNTQKIATAKKQSPLKWIFLAIGLVGLLIVVLVYQTLFGTIKQSKQMLTIDKGETYHGLVDKWASKSQSIFVKPFAKLYIKMQVKKPLHSGTYQIPENPSFAQILNVLQQGEKVAFIKVQIIEGKTAKDLYQILQKNDGIQHDAIQNNQLDIKQLGINLPEYYAPNGNLEGWFSPDTYYFNEGSSDKKVLVTLFERQYEALMKAWEHRQPDLPYQNPYEALIMASIIEKETSLDAERAEVAGVFVNRLQKGMRLQTDPTVIYGMGERYNGNITRADLQEKTAYNTYQIDGLPPTPIALPSIASIKASLNPNKTDAIFFVATGYGGHKFTSNLSDHNKAVQEYLKVMREKKDN